MLKRALKPAAVWLARRLWLLFTLIGVTWASAVILLMHVAAWLAPEPGAVARYASYPGRALQYFENLSIDWRFNFRGPETPTDDIVILEIDNDSMIGTNSLFGEEDFAANPDLRLFVKWPFPRETYAKVIQKLFEAGAKAVAIDVIFATPSNYGERDDETLRQALLANAPRLVLAANYRESRPAAGVPELFLKPNDFLMEAFPDATRIIGIVNYDPTERSIIRTSETRFQIPAEGGPTFLSFSRLTAEKAGGVGGEVPPLFYINYVGGANSFKTISMYKLFYLMDWEGRTNEKGEKEGGTLQKGGVFKDKIVLIGATASVLQDFHSTPFGTMPGVEVHANVLSNLLSRQPLRVFPHWQLLLILAGAAQGWLISLFKRPITKVVPGLLFLLAIGAVAQVCFVRFQTIVPLFTPWLIASLTSISITVWQATSEFLARQKTRKTLETYVSPNVAAYILQNQESYDASRAGVRKPCTILFSDIRGFTTMTEGSQDEAKLVEHLNEYLTGMVHCVFDNGGTLHKFIGDAVMAVWGDTHSDGERADALAAVNAALSMRHELARLNQKWAGEGKPPLKIGIGLNHGTVVVGDIGSLESPVRLEFTVIGDAVNVASRVESETKNQGVDILISRPVYELVKADIEAESRGEIALKGKAQKVELFHLKGLGIG